VTPAPSPPPALTAAPASEPEGDYLTYPIPPAEAEPEAVPSKWRLYRRPNDKSRSAKSRRDLR